MNVLSLFDGISCARVALDRAGLPVKTYFACEIDKSAIAISQKNYPDIVRLGDVREVKDTSLLGEVDLLIGGSPCQDLSIAKKDRKGLEGNRSGLFWEYVRILRLVKPKWFVLENVASMPKADKETITKELGVEPVLFDASLVSAQSRKRLFWTNLIFTLPPDRGIVLKDILEANVGSEYEITSSFTETETGSTKLGHVGKTDGQANRVYSIEGKSVTLSANGGGSGAKTGLYWIPSPYPVHVPEGASTEPVRVGHEQRRKLKDGKRADDDPTIEAVRRIETRNDDKCGTLTTVLKDNHVVNVPETRIRKLTPVECERLQGLPDGYTEGVAKSHRYKCLGNAFHVEVVAHILRKTESVTETGKDLP
jgi:DNA-cytosine methyltransferase